MDFSDISVGNSTTQELVTVGVNYPFVSAADFNLGLPASYNTLAGQTTSDIISEFYAAVLLNPIYEASTPVTDTTRAVYEVHSTTQDLHYRYDIRFMRNFDFPTGMLQLVNNSFITLSVIVEGVTVATYKPQINIVLSNDLTKYQVTAFAHSSDGTNPALPFYLTFDVLRISPPVSSMNNPRITIADPNGQLTTPVEPNPPVATAQKSKLGCVKFALGATDGTLAIGQQTDSSGLSVQQCVISITDVKEYPGGYTKDLIGQIQGYTLTPSTSPLITTYILRRPDFTPTLLFNGDSDLERILQIRTAFAVPDNISVFFENVCDYATVRYALAGLMTDGEFTERWLYQDRTDQFFEMLALSPFASLIVDFFSHYTGFSAYFRISP